MSEQVSGCGGVLKQRREKHRGEHMEASSALAFIVCYAGEGHSILKQSKNAAAVRQAIRVIYQNLHAYMDIHVSVHTNTTLSLMVESWLEL